MGALRRGDIFIVPTGDGRAGVGQVVATYGKHAYYFAIFDYVLPLSEAAERALEALSTPILLLALSMDAKVHVGHWSVVGHHPVDPSISLPVYKEAVGTIDNIQVVDHTGRIRRAASATEAVRLPYRQVIAPVRLEKALRAHLGLEPWVHAFDELRLRNSG